MNTLKYRVNKLETQIYAPYKRQKFCRQMAGLFTAVGVPMTPEEVNQWPAEINSYSDLLRSLPSLAD